MGVTRRSSGRGRTSRTVDTWEALLRAHSIVAARLERTGSYGDLAAREYDILLHLGRGARRGMRQRELLDVVLLPQPSLSRMLGRLEFRGLVTIEPDDEDRRGRRIALTEAGRAAQRTAGRLHVAELRRTFAGLSDDELADIERLAGRVERSALRETPEAP